MNGKNGGKWHHPDRKAKTERVRSGEGKVQKRLLVLCMDHSKITGESVLKNRGSQFCSWEKTELVAA